MSAKRQSRKNFKRSASGPTTVNPLPQGTTKTGDKASAPYPWCIGNPTVADCVKHGHCSRDPNCGE